MKNILHSRIIQTVVLAFASVSCYAQFGASPWTAPNGTYTIPAGVTSITVECWGGGGGGGGARESGLVQAQGGGGGGGANAVATNYTVTPGATITVTNGTAGAAGTSSPTAGGAGGASTVDYSVGPVTVCSAAGGSGGARGQNSFGAGGAGGNTGTGTVHNGGAGAAGANGHGGGGGGSAGSTTNGSNGNQSSAGAGGTPDGAYGGNGAVINDPGSAAGQVGQTPGGGGGGGGASDFNNQISRSAAGGPGTAGRVIITYTVVLCTPPTTQATGPITFSNITGSSLDYAFTRGNGDNVLVICKAGSAPTDPTDGTTYTANATYGSGTPVGGGFCIYNGPAAGASTATGNLSVTGLSCLTGYYFAVYEYNNTQVCHKFPGVTGNTTTTCSAAPAAPVASAATNATANSFTANWAAANCATGYRLDVATDNAFTAYVAGYQDLDVGNVLTKNVTGLSSGVVYYYRVRAYNTCGTGTNSNIITGGTTAVPSITSFTPTSGCAGSGTIVTITGNNFAGATAVSFNGTAATTYTVDNNTQITATLPAGANTGTITVTGTGGTATSSTNFTVNQSPVATATPASQSVCSGSNGSIALSSSVNGTTYTWSRDMVASVSGTMPTNGTTDPSGTLITTGPAPVTVTFTITPAANGCTGNDVTATIDVQHAPDMPGAITGTDTVCANGSYSYTTTSVSGATGYTWTLPNGWSGTSTNISINPTSGATGGNISVTADNNCGSSTAQTFAVYVIPTATTPTTISGPDSLCDGSTGTFTISPVAGATSYTWTLPNGWSGGSSTETLSATAGPTGGNITVVANNDCGSSSAQTHAVSISTTAPTLGNITGAQSACSGTQNTYTVGGGSGASSYTWTLPNGWTGSSTSNSISATAGSTGGTVSVIANSACGNSAPQTITVTVESAPVMPGTITGPASLCAGSSADYSITAVNGATGYTWTLPNGWTGTSVSESIHAGTNSTNGNVMVTADNNCGPSQAQSLAVTVNALPVTDFNFTGNPVCHNASPVTLSATPAGGTFSGTGVVSGNFNPSGLSAGNYDVIYAYTDGNGCSDADTSTITVTICNGIDDLTNIGGIKVYPNPLENGNWKLEVADVFLGGTLQLTDASGRVVFVTTVEKPVSVFDLDIAAGVYFLNINGGGSKRIVRLVHL